MIVGINFGISKSEALGDLAMPILPEKLSFFSDESVRKTDNFRYRILQWLSDWGFPLARVAGEETSFEKSFFQTNWLNTQTENADQEGTIENLIQHAKSFLDLVAMRQPTMILMFGKNLIKALNHKRAIASLDGQSVRERAIAILGECHPLKRHEGIDTNGIQCKHHLILQKFGTTQIICFPHPSPRARVTDATIQQLKPPLYAVLPLMQKQRPDLNLFI